jgi:hypothetical protein
MNAPAEKLPAARPDAVRPLRDRPPPHEAEPAFFLDCAALPCDAAFIEGIVLRTAGETLARSLLEAGAPRVYLGEAALLDGALVERLAAAYGAERIGLYVPARRMEVSWSMDTVSNADFRVMTPSICEPCWEILKADGSRSGTHAAWWLGEMFARGACSALLRVDMTDDADLNILAGLTERWGERLWLAPLADPAPDFAAWVELGGARRLAVPEDMFQNDPYLATLSGGPDIGLSNEGTG